MGWLKTRDLKDNIVTADKIDGTILSAATLASVANGAGASLVGVEDLGGFYPVATVEAILARVGPFIQAGGPDPGHGVAVPVVRSSNIPLTIGSAGAETNTVAVPTFLGQRLLISVDVVGTGTRVVTFASAINVAGHTIATFATARQTLIVEAIQLAGVLAWEVVTNNGTISLS
jgi:hypothetical protein